MKLYLMPLTGQKTLTIDNLEVTGNLHKNNFSRVVEMKACSGAKRHLYTGKANADNSEDVLL